MAACALPRFLARVVLFWVGAWQWGYAGERVCKPEVKYECSPQGCSRQTEGFAHAESYRYDAARGVLTACLWSGCFEGKARRTGQQGLLVVTGDLKGPKGERFSFSLTQTPDGGFSAVWHDASAPVLSMGTCLPAEKQP